MCSRRSAARYGCRMWRSPTAPGRAVSTAHTGSGSPQSPCGTEETPSGTAGRGALAPVPLDPADRAVPEQIAVPIGVGLRADALSAEVQRSRRAIVTAREEERRRLRRALREGRGPTISGIECQADAVVAATNRHGVVELGAQIRRGVTGAITDKRRLGDPAGGAVGRDSDAHHARRRIGGAGGGRGRRGHNRGHTAGPARRQQPTGDPSSQVERFLAYVTTAERPPLRPSPRTRHPQLGTGLERRPRTLHLDQYHR